MDWGSIVSSTTQLLRAAEMDLLAAEQTGRAAEADQMRSALGSEERRNRRQEEIVRKHRLIELRKKLEHLMLAPVGTPGVEKAIRNVELMIQRLR